jgi:hypothetical protein
MLAFALQKENTENVQAAEAETSRLTMMLEASERKCVELEAESIRARDGELRMKQQAGLSFFLQIFSNIFYVNQI